MRVLVAAADCVHADNLLRTYARHIGKCSVVGAGSPQKALRTLRLHLARIELATNFRATAAENGVPSTPGEDQPCGIAHASDNELTEIPSYSTAPGNEPGNFVPKKESYH